MHMCSGQGRLRRSCKNCTPWVKYYSLFCTKRRFISNSPGEFHKHCRRSTHLRIESSKHSQVRLCTFVGTLLRQKHQTRAQLHIFPRRTHLGSLHSRSQPRMASQVLKLPSDSLVPQCTSRWSWRHRNGGGNILCFQTWTPSTWG